METQHVARRLREVAEAHPDRVATRIRRDDAWVTMTFAQFWAQVEALGQYLVRIGVGVGDRVVVFARNMPEWTVADVAIASIRAISVPIYQTSTAEQVRYIASDSGAVAAFVGGPEEYEKLVASLPHLPALRHVVSFDAVAGTDSVVPRLADAVTAGRADQDTSERDARLAAGEGTDTLSIVYTSGTTGEPRGAMLGHRGMIAQSEALDTMFDITPDDHSLCFLPLSHALERAWTYHVLSRGCMNTYVSDPKKVAEALVEAKPTLMVSVPRLYEKVYATAHQKAAASPVKHRILRWALRVGGKAQRSYRKGRLPSLAWRLQLPLADALVLHSIRDALGGPKTVMASGGAPLRQEVEEFLSAAGLLVCQGYGLTETSPLISFNAPGDFKFGTVGRVMSGGEVRIAEQGEICYRGPNLMQGYWNKPEATAAAIRDGWLHTGDVGHVDSDGYLVITDRIKDIIVTSGGKNVAPATIEGRLAADPLIEYAVVLGDNRPFLTLLVVPSLPDLESLAKQLQITWSRVEDLVTDPAIVEEIRRRVREATAKLASWEQIKDLRVLVSDFTQENGLLTPTLKVKRREVEKRFAELVDDMYARLADLRPGNHKGKPNPD